MEITMRQPQFFWGKPEGVSLTPLTAHSDSRGDLTELFRQEWQIGQPPVQWNLINSEPHVLRGVHVHPIHEDYVILLSGRVLLGLCDIREDSPTWGARTFIELTGQQLQGVFIPNGVAHGFYFSERSTLLHSVSHYWNIQDELGCRWNDPVLNLPWPIRNPLLSERDITAGSFEQMCLDHAAVCHAAV
jgi:dTDP-4-dehydrorhamnose 3,5-epimerase